MSREIKRGGSPWSVQKPKEEEKPAPKARPVIGRNQVGKFEMSPDAKDRQLEGQTRGRRNRWEKERAKQRATDTPAPERDPFDVAYALDPVAYIEDQFYVADPLGSRTPGPIVLEGWQRDNLRGLFSKDPATGLRRYTLGVWSTPKKNGKSTIGAAIANLFLFQEEPFGEIIFAANSREQATLRAFQALKRSILLNPKQAAHCKVNEESIENTTNKTVAYVVSKNLKTVAGSNANLILLDEMWALNLESEEVFIDELTTSPARREPLTVITSYAGFTEEGPLWDVYKRGLAKEDPRMFFFWTHENPASWVTPSYLATQKTRLRKNSYLRLHENRWTSSESAFIDVEEWDACVHPDHSPALPDKGLPIYLGVDVSVSGDSTAVVATTRKGNRVELVAHRKWQPTPEEKIDLEESVEAYIIDLAGKFRIKEVRYDPYQFHRSATTLRKKHINMVEYPQTLDRLTAMAQNVYDLIRYRNFVAYPDGDFRKHASKAAAQETPRGWRIVKTKSSNKIDLIIALAMSAMGSVSHVTRDMRVRWIDWNGEETEGREQEEEPKPETEEERLRREEERARRLWEDEGWSRA